MENLALKKTPTTHVTGARRLVRDQRGVTLAEYGALLVLVIMAVTGALTAFKDKLNEAFQKGGEAITVGSTTQAPSSSAGWNNVNLNSNAVGAAISP